MGLAMTREQAAAAVAAATAEREGIQANLLDLDGSFGKRLLAGATLTGETKQRWDTAADLLGALWEIFQTYSAVIDQAALLLTRVRRSSSPELAEITELLTGPSVTLARAPAPLSQRRLTEARSANLAPAQAVREMTQDFARVAEVVTAAESVWNVLAAGLEDLDAQLRQAEQGVAGSQEGPVVAGLRAARDELARQRGALNADPLSFWSAGQVDTSHLSLLRQEVAGAAQQASELAAIRAQAAQRIAAASAAVAAAQEAVRELAAARGRAAEKIAVSALPPAPPDDVAGLVPRLADLERLRAAGQWARLAAELDQVQQQAAAARQRLDAAAAAATALLGQRDELRGLLGAYQAKAARLGGSDNLRLAQCHDEARDLLWTAPCDLTAAAAAVTRYQEAVLALSRPEPRQVSP